MKQTRQLSWMNYENRKTRADLAAFFRAYAPLFDQIILDDSFCTDGRGPESERARGHRGWSDYRQRLMVRVLEESMLASARAARPGAKLIVKYPLFNREGDWLAAKLRPGNVHSADDWEELRLPEGPEAPRGNRSRVKEVMLRAHAASAKPETYEKSEERGVKYAIRIPANESLERDNSDC